MAYYLQFQYSSPIKKYDMQEKNLSQAKADNEKVKEAHELAEKDIENDPDLNMKPKPGDDLDEGELARLEGED